MVKYLGPRVKITRRLGILPGLTDKISKKEKTPGQHGKIFYKKSKRTSFSDDYKQRLIEKQKVRFNYGITEKQLFSYYKKAKKKKGATEKFLLQLLETRLDCIVYRLGFAKTIPAARQLINHKHILVNDRIVNLPSFFCTYKDIISVKNSQKSRLLVNKNLKLLQEKRKLISQRYNNFLNRKSEVDWKGKSRIKLSIFRKILPNHLFLDQNTLKGHILSSIKAQNTVIRVNNLKLIEYYSR